MALSSIAREQAHATEQMEQKTKQLLDYLATKPTTKVHFYASDIILNIYLDALYLSKL